MTSFYRLVQNCAKKDNAIADSEFGSEIYKGKNIHDVPLSSHHRIVSFPVLQCTGCLNFLRESRLHPQLPLTVISTAKRRTKISQAGQPMSDSFDQEGNLNDLALSPRRKIGTQRVYQSLGVTFIQRISSVLLLPV